MTAACLALGSAEPAGATWLAPDTIERLSTSSDTTDVRLGTNDSSEAVVSWREGSSAVRAALRPSSGPFGSSDTLDADVGGGTTPLPRPALADDGRATVMWFSKSPARSLRFADGDASIATFGNAQDLFAPPQDLTSLDVVTDVDGATHVAYNGPGFAQYPRVWARTRGPAEGAVFGLEDSVGGNLTPGAPGEIALATATNGRSTLTFYSPDADVAPGSQQQHILGSVRAPGDAAWATPAPSDYMCCLSLGPQGASGIAMDAAGATYFVVHGVNDFAATPLPGPNFVLVGADGAVKTRQQLDPTWSNSGVGGTNGGAPKIAVDPAGNAWMAWAKEVSGKLKLFTAFRPSGEGSSFGKPKAVASDLSVSSTLDVFRLAATEGGAVIVWQGNCGVDGCDLESAVTGTASGVFTHVETIDAPTHRAIPLALANGISLTVQVGVSGSNLRVKLRDDDGALDLSRAFAGKKSKLGVARGSLGLNVKLTAEAAQKVAARSVVRLTLEVTATPPSGLPDTFEQKLVLRQ